MAHMNILDADGTFGRLDFSEFSPELDGFAQGFIFDLELYLDNDLDYSCFVSGTIPYSQLLGSPDYPIYDSSGFDWADCFSQFEASGPVVISTSLISSHVESVDYNWVSSDSLSYQLAYQGCPYRVEPAGECFANVCGDGFVLEGEVCDDGNTSDGDTCSADCSEITEPVEPPPSSLPATVALTFSGPLELSFSWLDSSVFMVWSFLLVLVLAFAIRGSNKRN